MKKYYILTVLVLFILNTQAKKPIEKARKKPINSSTNIKPADWFNDILVAPTVRSLKPSHCWLGLRILNE